MRADRFLNAAARIGRRLCRDAVWSRRECNWLGWAKEPSSSTWINAYRACSATVYDGTAGIGVFLARLAQLTGDAIIRTTAEGALAQALAAADGLYERGEYGYYSGFSGIGWCCNEAGALLCHDELRQRGRDAIRKAASLPPHPQRLDIINGSAGLIPILLAAVADEPDEDLSQAAIRHGDYLLQMATRSEQGWSWDTIPGERHLVGFSHGTSGMAAALAALAVFTGRDDFMTAAREALRYERHHFLPSEGNWPDLRSIVRAGPAGGPVCMLAWCHGAPGIGFARLQILTMLPEDAFILGEAEIALATTAASLRPGGNGIGNHSLCHGDFGNADLLIEASDRLERPALRQQAEAAGNLALDHIEDARMPWPCGVPDAGETPNLMLGLAGIGYFLLRLYDSRAVPTVLLPSARASASSRR